jgi:hypothetical protein
MSYRGSDNPKSRFLSFDLDAAIPFRPWLYGSFIVGFGVKRVGYMTLVRPDYEECA